MRAILRCLMMPRCHSGWLRVPALILAVGFSAIGLRAQDAPRSWGAAREPTPAEGAEIRAVIDLQLDAFRHADPNAAYEAAAPDLHRRFPDAGSFMTMARSAYAPLMAPAGRHFGGTKGAAATASRHETFTQSVDIVGADGGLVTAVYGLERQDDGSLKIGSCVLIPRRPNPS